MDDIWPSSSRKLYQIGINRDQNTIETKIIEATEFKYELRSDLGFKKPDFKKPNFKNKILRNPSLCDLKNSDSKKPDFKKPDFTKPDFT